MEKLKSQEGQMAKEQNVEAPKECASATTTAVLGRFEKLEKLKSKKASA